MFYVQLISSRVNRFRFVTSVEEALPEPTMDPFT